MPTFAKQWVLTCDLFARDTSALTICTLQQMIRTIRMSYETKQAREKLSRLPNRMYATIYKAALQHKLQQSFKEREGGKEEWKQTGKS